MSCRVRALLVAPLLVGAVLAVPACGDDGDDGDGAATTTSSPRSTSTTASTSTTTGGSSTVPTGQPEDVDGEVLPDGDHVAYVTALDPAAGTVTLDLAELLTGPEAAAAHEEDTGEPLDGEQFYLRNRNPKLRTMPLADGASYGLVYSASCCEPTSVTLADLAATVQGGWAGVTQPDPPFNVSVQGGEVTALIQMYLP